MSKIATDSNGGYSLECLHCGANHWKKMDYSYRTPEYIECANCNTKYWLSGYSKKENAETDDATPT